MVVDARQAAEPKAVSVLRKANCKCIQCRNVQSGCNMNESDDDLLMEEATEETTARGVLERTLVTTEDEGSTICNDSDADRLSLKATNEHASDTV